jgi:hypothetical protein
MNNLKTLLISNPQVTSKELSSFKFDNPQTLGGAKKSITGIRNTVKNFLELGIVTKTEMANDVGVRTPILSRFLNKSKLNIIDSEKLAIYFTDESVKTYKDAILTDLKAKAKVNANAEYNFKGENKNKIRTIYIDYLNKSNRKSGKFFTLPSKDCMFEIALNMLVDNNFHYIACEYDKSKFMDMKRKSADKNLWMDCYHTKSENVLKNAETDDFSHMFVDWCGTAPTYESEVRTIIDNNLVKVGGLIGLTFAQREANTKTQCSKAYHQSVLDTLDIEGIPNVKSGIELKLKSMVGLNYKLIEFIPYADDGGDMVFALIKRIG